LVKSLKRIENAGLLDFFWRSDVDDTASTIGIENVQLKQQDIEFTVLDFAGQPEYCTSHQVVLANPRLTNMVSLTF
jgi:hypothetical protein